MKKLFFLLFISTLIFLSCSKSPKDKAKEFVAHIYKIMPINFDEEKLIKASIIYDSLINSDEYKDKANNQDFKIALRNELEAYFRSITIDKPLPIKALQIFPEGNLKDYLILDTLNNAINYLGDESPAFRITLMFRAIRKLNLKIFDIEGKITLFDTNKLIIGQYNIHSTPDLINILEKGEGLAQVNTYLAPIWDIFANNPFKLAYNSLVYMKRSAFYLVNLNIKTDEEENINNNNDKKKKKNTDDLLDSLIIQD